MNRCMYSPNCQNPMMNHYGRQMQRPMPYSEPCRKEQYQESRRPMQGTEPCRKDHPESCHKDHPESCRSMHRPEPRRPMQNNSCGCKQDNSKPMPCISKPESCKHETCAEKPKYSRSQMLQYINEVSFAVNDILLYLDTHPCDREAMKFFEENVAKRKAALCDFAKFYGPLTVDTANEAQNDTWEWVMQPWPWEGREC